MSIIRGVPHPFPYQGSKRIIAEQIISYIPTGVKQLVEPFVGSGAVTIATAFIKKARSFLINDIHEPLISLWKEIIYNPVELANKYECLWFEQHGQERAYYDFIRDSFNKTYEPHLFLYLLARCVKSAIRYNAAGEFNNSPDNRRIGMRPETMRNNILHTSILLRERVSVFRKDYREILNCVEPSDLVYMDPPYQGVCETRDNRYCGWVDYQEFVNSIESLNKRGILFIISYDGRTGNKNHGKLLPSELCLKRLEICVGRSTQATLLGRKDYTYESLYLSPALVRYLVTIDVSSKVKTIVGKRARVVVDHILKRISKASYTSI
ncbi:MAG: DNA adenine methylase [Nitrospirae bacterium]|nr:DNA adenine methylase [Nitrospirota bacterium]